MIVQIALVRDENDNTLESPRWVLTDENREDIETYLQNNPTHYVIFGQKWTNE